MRPARLGSSRRSAYAGGGSAGIRQRQTCEPGSHLGSRVRTRCNLAESVPILLLALLPKSRHEEEQMGIAVGLHLAISGMGRMKLAIRMFFLASIVSTMPAMANCICQCVDGQMQPLCRDSLSVPPICPPTICPIMPPSVTPINPPTIPPIGTTYCRQARVCDTFGNCQWQQVCR